jgi:hypothetical protein
MRDKNSLELNNNKKLPRRDLLGWVATAGAFADVPRYAKKL